MGRPGGPLAHHWQRPKTLFKPIPRQLRRIKKYTLNVTALTPQGKKQYLCRVISERYGISLYSIFSKKPSGIHTQQLSSPLREAVFFPVRYLQFISG